jgi:hypothetical protein
MVMLSYSRLLDEGGNQGLGGRLMEPPMTIAQSRARQCRRALLVAAIIFQLAGAVWVFGPYLSILQPWLGAGLIGTPAAVLFTLTNESSYIGDAIGYVGLFFLTQWWFLSPRGQWKIAVTTQGRSMKRAVVVAALMVTFLTAGLVATLLEIPNLWGKTVESVTLPGIWAAMLLVWAVWTCVFYVYWRQTNRYTWAGKVIRALITGSVLELIIAAPVQAMTYHRDDCFCGRGSYTGVVFGGTVLLWAFGPGVAMLLLREKRRMHEITGS